MADEDGKPLAPALRISPLREDDEKPRPLPKCIACGAVHGGVGAGILCLENEILRLRGVIARLRPFGLGPVEEG